MHNAYIGINIAIPNPNNFGDGKMLSVTMAGLNAAQKSMDVTSNNMANANTVGFKRSTATFGDVYSNDPASNPKTSVGSGVLTSSVSRDTTAGAVKTTGRVTDMAIDGRGFFVVRDPSAKGDTFAFTRAGNFGVDAQGFLVDAGGNQLIGFNSVNSGTLDANGKPIMAPDTLAGKTAVRVLPQYTTGQALPDGSIVGQEIQLVSLKGPAMATGPISVGGVSVQILKGDSVEQMTAKAQAALTSAPSFSGRTVTAIGSGDNSQLKVAFGISETSPSVLTVDIPTAVSPSVSVKSPFAILPEIQAKEYDQVINDRIDWDQTFHMKNGDVSVHVLNGDNWALTVANGLNATQNANYMDGITASVDPNDPKNLLLTFNSSLGNVDPISVSGTTGDTHYLTEVQQGGPRPKTEEISFQPASSDMNVDIAGATVSIVAGDSATTIANKVQVALQTTFPARTIVVNGDKLEMTYAVAEGDAPLLQPKYAYKKPANGSVAIAAKASQEPILMQGMSISPKGEVSANYSNGVTYTTGFVSVATFANDGGLKDIGGNRFVQTGDSGMPNISAAGAPKAGNIMSGALEQANVDITAELMDMIRAQQVYNGNARVLQTTVDTVTKITDMR